MLPPKKKRSFSEAMSQHFGVLEGVETDFDDIIIHAYTEMKHDFRLNSVLDRCQKINLTLRHWENVSSKSRRWPTLVTNLHKRGPSPIMKKIAPLKSCRHQLTRKELKDYSVQSTTLENSFPIWHLSLNPLGCFC